MPDNGIANQLCQLDFALITASYKIVFSLFVYYLLHLQTAIACIQYCDIEKEYQIMD